MRSTALSLDHLRRRHPASPISIADFPPNAFFALLDGDAKVAKWTEAMLSLPICQ
jgi:hypothetical protein